MLSGIAAAVRSGELSSSVGNVSWMDVLESEGVV